MRQEYKYNGLQESYKTTTVVQYLLITIFFPFVVAYLLIDVLLERV